MQIENKEIARLLNEYADSLEKQGASPYRYRAYRRAAKVILNTKTNIQQLVEKGVDLTTVSHIGPGIAYQIGEIIRSGQIAVFPRKKIYAQPYELELMKVKGLGYKRMRILHEQLNISSLNDLKRALKEDEIAKLTGFGPSIIKKIKLNIRHIKATAKKYNITHLYSTVEFLLSQIKNINHVQKVDCVGDFRRKLEVIEELVFLISSSDSAPIIQAILELEAVKIILSYDNNHAKVLLHSDVPVSFYIVKPEDYVGELLFLTGSKKHYSRLKTIAKQKKMLLNQKGLGRKKKYFSLKTESEFYQHLNLQFIEPELRENRGEIELANKNKIPRLITMHDIKGDLHCHTYESDGTESLEVMVNAAIERGYDYIAITDHTKNLKITNGLDEKRLLQQIKLIDNLNNKLQKIVILKASEVDILEDGSLDLPNSILKELDLRVCSLHSKFRLSKEKQTKRLLRAMDNPYFNILGHPTGRLINSREPHDYDIKKVFVAAKERNCFLEINCQPSRLDLNDENIILAKNMGVKFAISSDAHSTHGLDFIKYGIDQASRAMLTAADVINTYSLEKFKKQLKRQ